MHWKCPIYPIESTLLEDDQHFNSTAYSLRNSSRARSTMEFPELRGILWATSRAYRLWTVGCLNMGWFMLLRNCSIAWRTSTPFNSTKISAHWLLMVLPPATRPDGRLQAVTNGHVLRTIAVFLSLLCEVASYRRWLDGLLHPRSEERGYPDFALQADFVFLLLAFSFWLLAPQSGPQIVHHDCHVRMLNHIWYR